MKQSTKNITLAASAFAFAALFSFGWSEQGGISLSIESAQARVGRPLTPVSVAGVARRQYRRAAIGTAAVVALAVPDTTRAVLTTATRFGAPARPIPVAMPQPAR